jgi:ATP dependent DNA ligase C terminal region
MLRGAMLCSWKLNKTDTPTLLHEALLGRRWRPSRFSRRSGARNTPPPARRMTVEAIELLSMPIAIRRAASRPATPHRSVRPILVSASSCAASFNGPRFRYRSASRRPRRCQGRQSCREKGSETWGAALLLGCRLGAEPRRRYVHDMCGRVRLSSDVSEIKLVFSPLVLSRVHWVRPELVAEVKYLTWTEDNLLRQVIYEGLREDKPAAEVRRDLPHPKASAAAEK